MKGIGIFIAILVVIILIYLYILQKKATEYAATLPKGNNSNDGSYSSYLGLLELINNTKCGKEGRPPCTKAELQASGWTPEQIAQAEAGSLAVQQSVLCLQLGIGC